MINDALSPGCITLVSSIFGCVPARSVHRVPVFQTDKKNVVCSPAWGVYLSSDKETVYHPTMQCCSLKPTIQGNRRKDGRSHPKNVARRGYSDTNDCCYNCWHRHQSWEPHSYSLTLINTINISAQDDTYVHSAK